MRWDEKIEKPDLEKWDPLIIRLWEEKLFRAAPTEFEFCRVYCAGLGADAGKAHKWYRERVALRLDERGIQKP